MIPQKGTFVEVGNRVLIGYVVEDRVGYSDHFENGTATLYYTGRQFPTTIALQDLHFSYLTLRVRVSEMCMR